MIEQDEKIIFVSNANAVTLIKENTSLNTGFIQKKVVLTTRRCMLFQSLANKISDTQYEVVSRKRPLAPGQKEPFVPRKSKISINEYPQYWFYANQRDCKVVIDQQPSVIKYFQKNGVKNLVKNTTGMVLLKNPKKSKLQILLFPTLKQGFRFAKGLICAKAWLAYQNYCRQNKIPVNLLWVRILQQIITHENSLTLIDPDLFANGSRDQIRAFFILIKSISFSHSFQIRYNIVNEESTNYTIDFIKNLQDIIHLLNLSKTSLNSSNLIRILTSYIKPKQLMKLNLQHNQLTDQCFNGLQAIAKQNKKLSFINLSYNQITLSNFSNFLEFLKITPIILNINLSYNKISDKAVQHIQKFILFALNPPIEEIDLSFNQFSLKGSWRLYVGFMKNFRNHVYLNFIIYPIPFKKEIFSQNQIDFPKKSKEINFNMHSALISQFQQQSIMKHTMVDILIPPETLTIHFIRQLLPNVRLPKNKQQVSKTLDLSNRIENFIYSSQSVQKIYQIAAQIKSFPFEVPPRTRNNFVEYLNKKLNEALLIRDHYSVKYILKSMKELQIPYNGYVDRLQKVELRDKLLCNRIQNILQFKHHEVTLNKQIDELVKQSLRLYLEGRGVQLLYYLKYYRDQNIEKLLVLEKYNPQHQLYGKMAAKNLSIDERVSSKDFIIPYQIKIQKKINENFYLHPWQTNYLILSQMNTKAFNECLQFLQQSQKRETFAKYFQRIEERVQFIKNQFALFTYKQFKVSYADLKVNACRLLFLYKNIQDTHFFLQIPIYIKKKPITCQKQIVVRNRQQFLKKYHIVNYPNINYQAKKNNFYNYPQIITRYQSQTFQNQVRKILKILNTQIFVLMQQYIHSRKQKQQMFDRIIPHLKQLIDIVRHSIYPEQIKQEIYLHLIGWRKGKFGRNVEVMQMIPWFTMYLKPPLQIQKYLVAAILQSKRSQMDKFSLCIVSDVNKPTPEDILRLDTQFVQRDWLPPDNILLQLIMNSGKILIQINLLDKKKITAKVSQSTSVSQLVSYIMSFHELACQDRQTFWLYKLDKETQETTPLSGPDYLGQILSNMMTETQTFICRRRIYSRQIKYVHSQYGQVIINSLYHQIKFDYMMRGLFDSDKNIFEVASLLFIIDNVQNFEILQKKNNNLKNKKIDQYIVEQAGRLQAIYPNYIPRQIMARIMKDKQTIFSQIKAKISERMLKQQHLGIYEMKTSFIRYFRDFPQFCSTNYKMFDKNSNQLKVFINCMYLYIESDTEKEYIKLQKIVSIIPKSKYILIGYHKNENILGQVPLFSEQVNILAVAMDLLSYCLMRLKMVSNNLYQISKYQRIEWQIDELEKSLKRVYDKSLEQKLFKNREERISLQAKIMKMSITLMNLKQMVYFNESKYIKSFLDRKLYANKSQRKMAYSDQMDEQQARQTQVWNRNVFRTIFPQYEERYGNNQRDIEGKNGQEGAQNNDYGEQSEYDAQFYQQNQPIKKNEKHQKLNINEPNSPSKPFQKPTQKKNPTNAPNYSNVNGLNNNPNEPNYNSTNKKGTGKNQSEVQPQVQPFDNNNSKRIPPNLTPLKIQQQKPIQQISKVPNNNNVNQPVNKFNQNNIQPVESNNIQPKNQVNPQQGNEEQDAVYSNKKQGGRVPPRRRQR